MYSRGFGKISDILEKFYMNTFSYDSNQALSFTDTTTEYQTLIFSGFVIMWADFLPDCVSGSKVLEMGIY